MSNLTNKTTDCCGQVECKPPTLLVVQEEERTRLVKRLAKLTESIELLKSNPELEEIYNKINCY